MRQVLLLALPALLFGCTTTRYVSSGEMAAVAPVMSVERFLAAVNARDLHGMARIFGTDDGPAIETGGSFGCAFKRMGSWIGLGDRCRTLQEVEVQMDLLARVLRHDDYTIGPEADVPGRSYPASRIMVNLMIGGREYSDVPFTVIRTDAGLWLVEEIGLDRVTNR